MTCGGTSCGCGMSDPVEFGRIDGTDIKKYSGGSWIDTTNRAERSFKNKLDTWVNNLKIYSHGWGNADFDSLTWIGSAGAYTAKDGCHGKGRAFDLEYLKWNGRALNIYSGGNGGYPWQLSATRTTRRLYLAVDASARRYFKWTLDGWYGNNVGDNHVFHIHMEDHAAPVLNKSSTSDAGFVQAVCNNFNGASIPIDGDWGPLTTDAWQAINQEWDYKVNVCNPENSASAWTQWQNLVMKHGFADKTAGTYLSVYCS